jgi:hypothetical protein
VLAGLWSAFLPRSCPELIKWALGYRAAVRKLAAPRLSKRAVIAEDCSCLISRKRLNLLKRMDDASVDPRQIQDFFIGSIVVDGLGR